MNIGEIYNLLKKILTLKIKCKLIINFDGNEKFSSQFITNAQNMNKILKE